jgi:hypothetical protein
MERVGVDATWEEFAAAAEDILAGRALEPYYDRAVLDSPLARRVFVMPGNRVDGPRGD